MRRCSVDGCERPHAARGWCKAHWRWASEHGWAEPTHLIGEHPVQFKHDLRCGEMSEAETAWAAGLFEGEGWCGYWPGRKHTGPRLGIKMVDRDVLETFTSIVGGGVTGPIEQRGNRQPQYQVQYVGVQALEVARTLYPHLHGRRQQQVRETFARELSKRWRDEGITDVAA